jgi:hypothetical protein
LARGQRLRAGGGEFDRKWNAVQLAADLSNIGADTKWVYFIADAFDASGNLFIDGLDFNGNALVGEIAGGCNAKSITTLSVGNRIAFPTGIQVYHGNVLIEDELNLAVHTYAPPLHGSLGSPITTTTLAGAGAPVAFAMMEDSQSLWTADLGLNVDRTAKYTYPGGIFVKAITGDINPSAVAVNRLRSRKAN